MRKALASGLIALTLMTAAPAVATAAAPEPSAPITSPAPAPVGLNETCSKKADQDAEKSTLYWLQTYRWWYHYNRCIVATEGAWPL